MSSDDDRLREVYREDREEEQGKGLLHKYDVQRRNDPDGKHDDCRYFVLDPQHDPLARFALAVYADRARAAGYDALATDLDLWLFDTEKEASDEQ